MFHKRLYVVYGFVVVVALIIIYRLVHIQLIQHDTWARMAENQYVGVLPGVTDRGSIFFTTRDGQRVTAATIQRGYKVFINPSVISNIDEVITQIQSILPDLELDSERIRERAARTNDTYEEIIWRISKEEAEAIRDLKIDGVGLASDQWRQYPSHQLASHIVGFVGYNENILEGRYGLEKFYQSTLVRSPNKQVVNFFAQVYSDEASIRDTTPSHEEGDIVTSIEPQVQTFLDAEVIDIHEKWSSEQTGALILRPSTGEIVALSTSERFDLNDLSGISNDQLANPFVERVYEMGSIIKPLIMSMALQEQVISPSTPFYDSGSVKVGKYTISNFDKRGRGQITMTEVLQQSLNTGMVWISQHLSRSVMKDYLYKLGLNEKTGIDLPYEIKSLTSNLESGREVEYANVSFGQGIALTPMATVRALSALANHGTPTHPHIVTAIDKKQGGVVAVVPPVDEQVFTQETVEQVTRMLVGLVDNSFKNKYPALEGYSIAAKTGTAQVANPQGGYYGDRNLHSFFGYFPAYDPEYLIFFYTIYPKHVRYSSETLSGPFMETTQFLVEYYNIPPDRIVVE
ncbi:penicillin-binding protein 2 [Candidatus Nomurabacteria bacterium]|nr:penicillin-binding protein 2 [Candidatus Nomurabacteria bacterium]